MSNDLEESPPGTRVGNIASGMLLVAALLVALFVLRGQLVAITPVGWLSPIQSVLALQMIALSKHAYDTSSLNIDTTATRTPMP